MHNFRMTAARNLVCTGVTESIAMKITGHKGRSVFEGYNICTDEDLKFAAELQAQNTSGVKNGVKLRNSLNRVAF